MRILVYFAVQYKTTLPLNSYSNVYAGWGQKAHSNEQSTAQSSAAAAVRSTRGNTTTLLLYNEERAHS